MYVPFLLWTCVCMYMCLLFYSSACIRTFIKVNLRITLSWPSALWSVIWVSCHQGQRMYYTSEWVVIKDNTCIIMPTISPFGLDGNHHSKSLSPLDIKGKGSCSPWVHAEFSDMLKCINWDPMIESMLPLSTSKVCKKITWLYRPSCHQWLIHTSISQPSEDIPNLTHPPNQVGIQIRSFHDLYIKWYARHI